MKQLDFSLQRQCRIAGTVVLLLGWVFNSLALMLFGNLLWVLGYAWSITKIENALEVKEEEKDERN